jgi:hypothetical protein
VARRRPSDLVRVEGTPRSHARDSSTDFDDISAYRRISEELLDRWRRSLGPDDPDTLTLASNLTITLVDIGEYEQARRLGQDTLDRCRRVLGPDHLITLTLAQALNSRVSDGRNGETA